MQIYNITPSTNQTVPNFKAIKSVKCEGLYKEFPRYGKDLVETFKKNPTAMEFCRKYDVKVPVVFKMKSREQVEGSHFQPLPIKELRASFEILKSNPHIKIDLK